MGIGEMLEDSFEYTKETFIGKWVRWVILIICSIIFPLIMGYSLNVMRGKKPAPEPGDWGKTFIDGLLYFVISLIYSIPIIILAIIFIGPAFFMGSPTAMIAALGIGLILTIIVGIIIGLIASMAIVRFAREEKFGEAFNFKEIIGKIKAIGWLNLFIKLLVLEIFLGVIYFILMMIPVLGPILMFILMPAFTIFAARYICIIYDSA